MSRDGSVEARDGLGRIGKFGGIPGTMAEIRFG